MRKIILFVFVLTLPLSALAEGLSLAGLFSDGMVLQRNAVAPVWGWAQPGTEVTVTLSWSKTRYKAQADKDGRWEVGVNTPEAGGPFEMEVRAGKERLSVRAVWRRSFQQQSLQTPFTYSM